MKIMLSQFKSIAQGYARIQQEEYGARMET